VIAIEWDWGDGTVETSWFPASHQYTEPNTYTVTVTAIDDQNNRVSQSVIAEVFAPKGCYPLNAITVICGY
jgi:PKD repeat protein